MRILLASDHFPPFVGGAQRQTSLLAQQLRARGHEVCVATVWQDGLPTREDADGVEVVRLHQLRTVAPLFRGRRRRRHQPPFPDPVTVVALRRLIQRFQPDVVHAAGWFSYSCAAALLGTQTPLLYSARDYGFICANATLVRREALCPGPQPLRCLRCSGSYYGVPKGWLAVAGVGVSRRLLRHKLTALHSVSSYVDDVATRELLGDGRRLPVAPVVIPSFRVEAHTRRPEDGLLDGLPTEPFILFVGALRRVKGVGVLLEAYQRLENAPPLVLVGTHERDSPSLVATGVVLVSELPHHAVLQAWDRSLFGVMPSLWPEPFGSVMHEAMSRGKAVIGTSPGGHTDMVVNGETGLVVPAGDVDALARAMRRLIDDPELTCRLGAQARVRARAFDADVVLPQFEALYARMVDASQPSSSVATDTTNRLPDHPEDQRRRYQLAQEPCDPDAVDAVPRQ